jgi:uncharacterized repeat protein (TIGR03847 family)
VEDFGIVGNLEAEAIGEPGHRTFRLRLRSGEQTAALWLEKEQLQALAIGLMQLLVRVGKAQEVPASDASPSPLLPFPERPTLDLKVGRLGLGYHQAEESVALFAYELEEEKEAQEKEAAVVCRASIDQCRDLIAAIEAILAAGRPICRLCLTPIDPEGHVCARHNGNRPKEDLGSLR